jgi:hypothetical protein
MRSGLSAAAMSATALPVLAPKQRTGRDPREDRAAGSRRDGESPARRASLAAIGTCARRAGSGAGGGGVSADFLRETRIAESEPATIRGRRGPAGPVARTTGGAPGLVRHHAPLRPARPHARAPPARGVVRRAAPRTARRARRLGARRRRCRPTTTRRARSISAASPTSPRCGSTRTSRCRTSACPPPACRGSCPARPRQHDHELPGAPLPARAGRDDADHAGRPPGRRRRAPLGPP